MKIIFLKKKTKTKKSKSRKGNFLFVLSRLPGIEYNWGRSVAHKEIICLLNPSISFQGFIIVGFWKPKNAIFEARSSEITQKKESKGFNILSMEPISLYKNTLPLRRPRYQQHPRRIPVFCIDMAMESNTTGTKTHLWKCLCEPFEYLRASLEGLFKIRDVSEDKAEVEVEEDLVIQNYGIDEGYEGKVENGDDQGEMEQLKEARNSGPVSWSGRDAHSMPSTEYLDLKDENESKKNNKEGMKLALPGLQQPQASSSWDNSNGKLVI